jgi:hypothetical protein
MRNFSRTGFSLLVFCLVIKKVKGNRLKPVLLNSRRDGREIFSGLGGTR